MPAQDISLFGKEVPADPCPVCASNQGTELTRFAELGRITSDCRIWPAGGRLRVCGVCGLVFKPFDSDFRRESDQIYASYQIYHQSGGREQRVRHPITGVLTPRSEVLADRLAARIDLPALGSLLDIGCGNGGFLRAFGGLRPGWELRGTEHDDRHLPALRQIPGFVELLTGELGEGAGPSHDVVSLIHILEHSGRPVDWLARALERLKPGGRVFIQCPDAEQNPFDLLTADHAVHFSPATLRYAAARSGLRLDLAEPAWIQKELSGWGGPAGPHEDTNRAPGPDPGAGPAALRRVQRQLDWLESLAAQARTLSESQTIGCFGTSVAGTWLCGQLDERIGFFVDEDPDRAGSVYLGRPVCRPEEVAAGSTVLLALAPSLARSVEARLTPRLSRIRFVVPDPIALTR